MEVSINIYCSKDHHQWLVELLGGAYTALIEKIEAKVCEEKIGLPWEWEREIDPEAGEIVRLSPELQEGFEVSFSQDYRDEGRGPNGVLVTGAAWILRDFVEYRFPPLSLPEGMGAALTTQ